MKHIYCEQIWLEDDGSREEDRWHSLIGVRKGGDIRGNGVKASKWEK